MYELIPPLLNISYSSSSRFQSFQSSAYRDNQHKKVATQNILPVNSQVTEAHPEDTNVDTEDIIEEDTGLTQQIRTINPSPTLREVPGTDHQGADSWPWSEDSEISNPEYPEQQNDSDNNTEDNSQTVCSIADIPEVLQSHNDNPDEPDDTGYPDTLKIRTGTAQDPDPATYSVVGQEGTFTTHKETSIPEKGNSGSERPPRVEVNQGGLKMGTIPYAPVLDEFLRKSRRGRPPGVKLKNTTRVRAEEPCLDSNLRGDVNIDNKFSSQTGTQGAPPKKDKTCEPTSNMILLSKQSHDTEFPILTEMGSEADHNFFPWRGSEISGKWVDIVKRNI